MPSTPELRRTSLSLPWLTSWHVSPGLCFQRQRLQTRRRVTARKRRLRLGSARRSHFPAPRRRLKFPHRRLHRSSKDERTVTTACLQPGTENGLQRPTDLEGQTRAQLIMARRADLHSKAEYICADLSSRPNYPLQSCGGPYILGTDQRFATRSWYVFSQVSLARRKHIQRLALPKRSRTASPTCSAPSFAVAFCERILEGAM